MKILIICFLVTVGGFSYASPKVLGTINCKIEDHHGVKLAEKTSEIVEANDPNYSMTAVRLISEDKFCDSNGRITKMKDALGNECYVPWLSRISAHVTDVSSSDILFSGAGTRSITLMFGSYNGGLYSCSCETTISDMLPTMVGYECSKGTTPALAN